MSLIIKLRQSTNLTPTEQTVAQYILNHPADIPQMHSQELAQSTYTSQATISRLCRKIGTKSYTDFKMQLAVELSIFTQNQVNIEQANDIGAHDSIAQVVEKLNSMSIDALKETKIIQSAEVLATVQHCMQKARAFDFYGSGASHFVALDANYKFMRIQKSSAAYALLDQQMVQASNGNETHLAFIFSYSGETEEMLQLAEILRQSKTPLISVTKDSSNRLAGLAQHNLFVTARENLYRSAAMYSRMSMLHIVDILYSLCLNLDYESTMKTLARNRISKGNK